MSLLKKDENGYTIQSMDLSAPQTIIVNGSAGAATLSAAIAKGVVRLQPTVDCFIIQTVAGAVTSATGHYLGAGGCYDVPMGVGNTKVSVLAVGTGAGTLYLSELG